MVAVHGAQARELALESASGSERGVRSRERGKTSAGSGRGFGLGMAPAVGFDPTTNGLTFRCATAAPRRISLGSRAYSKPSPRAEAPPARALEGRGGIEPP